MRDISLGLIDMIVVYKIDRLSRSLADFVKMVDEFEKHKVTFVSITQAFNTTTSMGRLMLNVLLSFAQFEREVTGERIRDKFEASRRKGMWMGGTPPFGYDVIDRKLHVNQDEAKIVQEIFVTFTQNHSCIDIMRTLRNRGVTTKTWTTQSGLLRTGQTVNKQFIYRILHNRLYIGDAVHKGTAYQGEHEAIIDMPLWNDAHRILNISPRTRSHQSRARQPALLKGFVHCACCGSAMTPSSTGKRANGKSYRYYVCMRTIREGKEACPIRSVPAGDLEEAVLYQIKAALKAPELIAMIGQCLSSHNRTLAATDQTERESLVREELKDFDEIWNQLFAPEKRKLLTELLAGIEVSQQGVQLHLKKNNLTRWIQEAHHENTERGSKRNNNHQSAA